MKNKQCKQVFKSNSGLQKHLQSKHPDPKLALHVCSYCAKPFANQRSLNKHVNKLHKGNEDGFQCDQCELKTSTRIELDRHKLDVHIPKQCEKCKKFLDNRVKWRLHRKTCTKKGGLKTASCAPQDVRPALEEVEQVEDGVEGNRAEDEEEQREALKDKDEEDREDQEDEEDEEQQGEELDNEGEEACIALMSESPQIDISPESLSSLSF